MNRLRAWVARGWARGTLLIAVPFLVAAVATAGAAAYPRSIVHGNIYTGPRGLAFLKPVTLDYKPTVHWGPHRASVLLVAHPLGDCRVHVRGVTSTAPGRIEVSAVETGGPCVGAVTVQIFRLPLPTLQDPRKGVRIQIGAAGLHLLWTKKVPAHPKTALDTT